MTEFFRGTSGSKIFRMTENKSLYFSGEILHLFRQKSHRLRSDPLTPERRCRKITKLQHLFSLILPLLKACPGCKLARFFPQNRVKTIAIKAIPVSNIGLQFFPLLILRKKLSFSLKEPAPGFLIRKNAKRFSTSSSVLSLIFNCSVSPMHQGSP